MPVCPNCAHENPEGARFCNTCAAPLAAEAATAPRQERKVVSVLFADLVGFTSRAEQLDPEDVRAILSGYHERVRSELERYGGTVEKFVGDAVMAVFGAPVVHEDDPERAVRAALAVTESIAELNEQHEARDLHVRIGITTGETLIRLDVRPEEGEGMAAGDVVNTAARLQAAAPPDGILVDETTYRATDRVIGYGEELKIDAKGKADKVIAYEVVEARSRFGVDVHQSGRTPLVGRSDELQALADALARARRLREPQFVTLVGVPGIGKSRLVFELFGRVEDDPELVAWRQGRCLPYGEGVAYWAFAEMVKAQAGILETDTEEEASEKLSAAVADVGVDERDAAWLERNLRPLLGLAAEAELTGDRRGEVFAAWRRFLEALADKRPLVLVFEDLHFADDGMLDFVDYLAGWSSGVPLLLVATARPELLARRADWGGGKANTLTLSLSSLSDADTAQLVHALLDRAVLPAELQQRLLERAEGNPLYAEEFARLVAEGRQPDELPETVQGIIAARIDGLVPEEKALLQDAAVVGKVFWLGAVAGLGQGERWTLEERLHALERKEFVRRERRSSVAAESEYAFRHLLVRDVAYGQIPRAARAEKHRRAAEWLEGFGRTEDQAEMLAHHYLAALELARAAGQPVSELVEPARRALREAGDRAFALYAFPAAARFYGEALSLAVETDPELSFRRAEALYRSDDEESERALEEAREGLVASEATERAAEADALLADVWWTRGESDRCFEHLLRAEKLVRDGAASAAKARVLSQIARFRALAGEAEAAIVVGQEALAVAEQLGLVEVQAHALNNIAGAKGTGGLDGAIADVERSIEIALSISSPEAARGYNNLSALLARAGDFRRSFELRDEAVRVAERLGAASTHRYARGVLPMNRYHAGRWDEAVQLADAFVVECESDPHYGECLVRYIRATIRLARDDSAGALEDARRSLDVARRAKDPQILLPALAVDVRVNLELGLEQEAEQTAIELVLELRRQPPGYQTEYVVPACLCARAGGLAGELRRVHERLRADHPWVMVARDILDERFADAAAGLLGIGDVANEAYARLRAAEQHAAVGRRAEAGAELDLALAFYRSVGATRYIRQGEALLAASA
jgi:class 3 adenylate cyclase/tetratricopeptide (TPR) repeat protein